MTTTDPDRPSATASLWDLGLPMVGEVAPEDRAEGEDQEEAAAAASSQTSIAQSMSATTIESDDDTDTDETDPDPDDWHQWLEPRRRDSDTPQDMGPAPPSTAYLAADVDNYYDDGDPQPSPVIDRSGGTPRTTPTWSLPSRPRQREPRGSGPLHALGVVALVVLVVAVVLGFALNTHRPTTSTQPGAAAAATTSITQSMSATRPPHAHTLTGCEQTRSAGRVSGSGTGGTTDGPSAILAFEHAYYVRRSGSAVREIVDGTTIPTAEQIQAGIAAVPADTAYCVSISPAADGRWLVELAEQWPGEPVQSYRQVVTTAERDGRTLITAIAPA
ncbi:hypothetical protein ACFQZZ_33295 [Nocardia sp. GCM10030253]|uniref:hypothetical protein n=1 Tax=Nocardia sp. GCM10030253 TaxID=3273404 RepID=UPI0036382B07